MTARRLADTLRNVGLWDGRELNYIEAEVGVHHEDGWTARMLDVLLFVWTDPADPDGPSSDSR
ncbi:MAG: hypothetical protein KF841_08925 [Phycisphaerae bacterium]|nr:hypothetical protein [Phycisphaerae bacterium]